MASRPPRPRSRVPHRPPQDGGFLAKLIDPIDWLTQTIYAVLALLTFTLAFRIILLGDAARQQFTQTQLDEVLVAAAGATLAWGVIDGVMYAMLSVFERGERQRLLTRIQSAPTDEDGIAAISEELDYILDPITSDDARRGLYSDMLEYLRESKPQPIGLKREDILGGLGSLLVTVIAVLPPLAPFVLLRSDPYLAIRISNVISFAVLFLCGYSWGRHTRSQPLRTGLLVMAVGAVMAMIAIPLGG